MEVTTGTRSRPTSIPEINIREITQRGRYWEQGEWKEIDPMSESMTCSTSQALESEARVSALPRRARVSVPEHPGPPKRIRFWMTFGEEYLTHLRVLQNVGMTSIEADRL